jgi:septal ring factor EnvC (AmiA/AmiB activator)
MSNESGIFSDKLFRTLVVAALLSGAGGGAVSLNSDASDRLTGTQAREEHTRINATLGELRRQNQHLREQINRHLEHSAKWTEVIRMLKADVERLEQNGN